MTFKEADKELTDAIQVVETLAGTYDMDSSEFYNALDRVVVAAKQQQNEVNI